MNKTLVVAAAVLACTTLPALAQSTMKPGLWEINNKMSGGQMDSAMAEMQKQLEGMPPEQRKQMEAMLAQRGMRMGSASKDGMAVQMCITREMVERNDMATREGCTTTKNQRSGNTVKVAFTCKNPPSSGEGEMNFTPESYTSHMTIHTTAQGKPETTVIDGKGKWLKADCGSIKPPASAK